ncbi:MAG: hypothetical protein ACOC6B_04285 [Thermodesulfobacteriota bacterium]
MKTGVIVYVTGNRELDDQIDFEQAAQGLNLEADRVEVVLSLDGDYDVMDAWWSLTAKGMTLIVCKMAEVANRSRLELTGRELKLCG